VIDILLLLGIILLALTIGVAIAYSKRLLKAQREYEKAKEVIDDIVLSFNRQLGQEAERLELVAYKAEAVSSKIDGALKRTEVAEKSVQAMEPKIASVLEDRDRVLARVDETSKRIDEAVASHSALATRITNLEEQAKHLSAIPELNVDAVIPIRREKALAPLTETELSAMEILASEGSMTAPQIKWKIRLSREHTARLMKKLYESGYLERDMNKIPFKYSVKKEMEKFLKKSESEVA
jgi:DNA repair exonuclease SbcCD ATPase subunit